MSATPQQLLVAQIKKKRSFLCIGLDPDIDQMPAFLLKKYDVQEAVVVFCAAIIQATQAVAVAYKLNLAFFEAMGLAGYQALLAVKQLVPKDTLCIADAKRADVPHTAKKYAISLFEVLGFDAVTLLPYLGQDSLAPFLAYPNKWSIIVTATSNEGFYDFQNRRLQDKEGQAPQNCLRVWEACLQEVQAQYPKKHEQLMYVIGGTHPDVLQRARKLAPSAFFLVPGLGAQGANLRAISANMTDQVGLLVNASRSILYANNTESFAEHAQRAAEQLQQDMSAYINPIAS